MYVSEFKHKGVLVGLHNDHLSDIYAEAKFDWQQNADSDGLVFVYGDEIVDVFDMTGKLADDEIRTAYIGADVEDVKSIAFEFVPYIDIDVDNISKTERLIEHLNRVLVILEALEYMTRGEYCQTIMADIDSPSYGSDLGYYVSDHIHEYSKKCLGANIDSALGWLGLYDSFLPDAMERARLKYWEHCSDDYFAPYRLEWLLEDESGDEDEYDDEYDDDDDDDDDNLLEELRQLQEDGVIKEFDDFQGMYMGAAARYFARLMLERGAFTLLDTSYRDALYSETLNNNVGYIIYAIDKFLETADQAYIDEHKDGAVMQLEAIKAYFGDSHAWLKEQSDDEFLSALKRLSSELKANVDEPLYEELSPLEELKKTFAHWVCEENFI